VIHFLDSSALVKRYLAEPGSDLVRRALKTSRLAAARITQAEVSAAIARAHRERGLTIEQRDALLDRFEDDFAELTIVELRAATIGTVRDLVTKHPLRAYDAVQLACALALRRTRIALTFWSADGPLCTAATAEGIRALHVHG
jgi:predicted nucleic acid-binding protein